jgi:fucose 4-O-acetylase-like acetyltransferase
LTVSIPASILMISLSSSMGLAFNGNVNWLMTFGKYSIVIYLVHFFFVHSLYGGGRPKT